MHMRLVTRFINTRLQHRTSLSSALIGVPPAPALRLRGFARPSSLVSMSSYPDTINITQLSVRMHVGVDGWERVQAQPVLIDASVHTDVSQAGLSDHLPHSIHYGILVKELEKHCAEKRYRSLEALAEGLAKVCIFICHAPQVTLRVEKPRSLLHATAAGVSLVRSASDYGSPDLSGVAATQLQTSLDSLELVGNAGADDVVLVRDLSISTILGVNPWERVDRQQVLFNLRVWPGTRSARTQASGTPTRSLVDRVTRPQNYRTLVRAISAFVERTNFKTVESLATAVARVAVRDNGVERIRVRVDKPSAIMFAKAAGVEVERDRAFFEREAAQEQSHFAAKLEQASSAPVAAAAAAAPAASILSASHVTKMVQSQVPSKPLPPAAAASAPANGAQWHVVAVALGSNLGNRAAHIERAVQALANSPGCRLVDTSFLYETKPLYLQDQPRFLNAACRIATQLAPLDLLALTQSIETNLGRDKRGVPDKGPRVIDLDIIFYDTLELVTPTLTLPHAGVAEREFVLRPLADILPHYRHPTSSRTVAQLLNILVNSEGYDGAGDIVRVMPLSSNATAAVTDDAQAPQWEWGRRTFIMGILNATPDSFSDGGDVGSSVEAGVAAAKRMVEQGADMLDVGGMSTAPQAAEVSADEEASRVVPLIQALRASGITTPISIDTFRASVARAALSAGASAINDVTGGSRDPQMLSVAVEAACPLVLMHMRGDAKTMHKHAAYAGGDVVGIVARELTQRLDAALRAGVRRWNIIVDPGIGFAKDQNGNLELLRGLKRLTGHVGADPSLGNSVAPSPILGPVDGRSPSLISGLAQDAFAPNATLVTLPLLVGPSRKRFLGTLTGRAEPKERVYGTAAACAASIAGGADVIRVHDVDEMRDVARTADAIFRLPPKEFDEKA